ncbi:hypothetical protein H4219_001710 [Mycoemilia scoparia]|uniref:Transmembrane protein n=1 Tax=Mycoemilia scoparia TaxID=417184 RepID=A0A9W8DQ39_9FUNG|nr:hypothetical protein H4219_001710 [Mycoemilia scoparia]
MSSRALDIIANQVNRSNASEEERNAVAKAQRRVKLFGYTGFIAGSALGYYMVRKRGGPLIRLFMSAFNGGLFFNVGSVIATFRSLKQFDDKEKYPYIRQAILDVQSEMMKSRGVDPKNPNMPPVLPSRKPDFNSLPPSKPADKQDEWGVNEQTFSDLSKDENAPGAEKTPEKNRFDAWDRIRNQTSNESAWDRIRRQKASSGHSNNQSISIDSVYGQYQHPNITPDFSSDDSGSAEYDFPRTREDFENEGSPAKKNMYGDAVYTDS